MFKINVALFCYKGNYAVMLNGRLLNYNRRKPNFADE